MIIKKNISLFNYNTFGIDVSAKYFTEIATFETLNELSQQDVFSNENLLVLGGGSNILLTNNINGLVIKNNIKGFEIVDENEKHILIKIGAGEIWHELVNKCVANGWGGIENLSLIPGNVGTAPMQNIGAYGVEIQETFIELEAFEIATGKKKCFNKNDCQFGYRESIFKNEIKNKYIILNITLQLNKKHELKTNYGDIHKQLEQNQIKNPTIKDVSNVIIQIRRTKLPDPEKIGNSGSFFKNPIITINQLATIQKKYPKIVYYPINGEKVKVAAGWLIDQAGWKGKTFGKYGVHKNQALVLVNYGGSNGKDIYKLSQDILEDIQHKFDIVIEREVNVI